MVKPFRYDKLAARVDKILAQYGRSAQQTVSRRTYLRRAGVDREVKALEAAFEPREVDGAVVQINDVRYLLSVVGLDIPPDKDSDTLILDDDGVETRLIIVTPPKRTAPGGVNVFWQLHCREE